MEGKEEAKPIEWDSSGLYISLPSVEDCGAEPTAGPATASRGTLAAATAATSVLAKRGHKHDMLNDWRHLSCDSV